MRYYRYYIVIVLLSCFLSGHITAQAIDNTVSFRNINSDHYIRINYENDFFTASDRDYTQGIYVECVNPFVKKFLPAKILWHPRMSELKYGISVEHDGYTPNQIDKPGIQYGDRPYAGVLLLKTFLTATNTHMERVSTQLSIGIIGPAAGGEGMQKTIHHWIHYTQPLGWHNQVSNDAVINYQLNYERELLSW